MKISDPVFINGFKVGTVKDIFLKPEDLKTIIVVLDISKEIKLPTNTIAELYSYGVMGTKAIDLLYEGVCSGSDCLGNGDYIKGSKIGFIKSLIGTSEFHEYLGSLQSSVGGIIDTVNARLTGDGADSELGRTFADMRDAIHNLKATTYSMNYFFEQSTLRFVSVLDNVDAITLNLRQNNQNLSLLLENVTAISSQLRNAELDSTLAKTGQTMASAEEVLGSLKATLESATVTFEEMNVLFANMQQGDGTMGKLFTDKALYESLLSTSNNLELLLQDFRLNPKRYVNVSVFGKKQKEYTPPENDPSEDEQVKVGKE